jgi:hypothetical protein
MRTLGLLKPGVAAPKKALTEALARAEGQGLKVVWSRQVDMR